jgi:hypothetical protein
MSELAAKVRIHNERALKPGLGGRDVILSPDEIIKLIKALTAAEKTALVKIARYYAKRTTYDYEDLINEAYSRVLDPERRTWRSDVPPLIFLGGVMRSIAWEWRSESSSDGVDVGDDGAGARGANAKMDAMKIVMLFEDDPVAQKIVVGMMEGARGEELEQASGLDKTEYESKRKKIRRRIEKLEL